MTPTDTTAPARPAIDRSIYLQPSPYDSDGGNLIGRHPREVPIDLLRKLPAPKSPLKALRAKCIDCSGGNSAEVRKCTAVFCDLWPYRMGFGPYHARASVTETEGGLEGSHKQSAATLVGEAR